MAVPDAPATYQKKLRDTLSCGTASSNPLFMPAIYEHKGYFIGETPSAIARDGHLLAKAILKEYELIRPDALTVGVDVYNLEAEAVGCKVTYYEGDDTSIPGISPGNHAVKLGEDLSKRPLPNPLTDGRMPVNLEAARLVRKELGETLWIRGALSGPFSLAISLLGPEELFICCLDDPDFAKELFEYSGRIIREFAKAYIDVGVDLILFDSQASPDLLPPDMFEEMILPVLKGLITDFRQFGIENTPLIIGGNTVDIIPSLIESGANNLLCDFTADWDAFAVQCGPAKRAVRRNISPRLIESSTPENIYETTKKEIARCCGLPGFIMGTAVIPYGSPTENILAIREACSD